MTINGKKNRLKRADFDELAKNLGIPVKSSERVYAKFAKKQTAMCALITQSFLPFEMKQTYEKLLKGRIERIECVTKSGQLVKKVKGMAFRYAS